MKNYTGDRTIDGISVLVDGQPLDPRFDLRRLSGTGFEWTYEGGAPAQLALALLAREPVAEASPAQAPASERD